MIKLILSDMDGTLVNDQGNIPADFPEVFAALKERNIIFSAASGRQYYNLLDNFPEYKDDILFLAENGSYIVYKGEEIYSNPMDPADVKRVIQLGDELKQTHNIDFMINGKKAAYTPTHDEEFIRNVKLYCGKIQYINSFDEIDDDIVKIAYFDHSGQAPELYKHFATFNDTLHVILSSAYWVDIMKADANKGDGLKHIMEKLNLKADEVAAFGDYMNDYEMMQTAYHSYAMKNAFPKLKEAARFETEKTNNEAGVTYEIKKLLQL